MISALEQQLLQDALAAARDTRFLEVDTGVRQRAAAVFASLFGARRAIIVADENTFRAAGRDVQDSFSRNVNPPFIFARNIYAEYSCVEKLHGVLSACDAVPVAVGSGTINDLTKLVAHQLGRPYMVVATAASMDGYTAYGASITYKGSKQTFDCAAPYVPATRTAPSNGAATATISPTAPWCRWAYAICWWRGGASPPRMKPWPPSA